MNQKTLAALKPAIVLTAICMVAALLLAFVNSVTAPIIEKANKDKQLATLGVVLPGAEGFEELSLEQKPATVQKIYKETTGKGYALLMAAESGYHTLQFSLGIDAEGKIAGLSVTSTFHSGGDAGFGSALPTFLDSLIGKGADLSGAVDKVTNASRSSAAMRGAISDAFALVESLKGGA